jgi:16S rRNA (adenine1518-N6/adenine1519-N6)-dimethyltransferase
MLKKRYGQHFLSDPAILRRIAAFAGVGPNDTVVEIGPGAGTLTRELAGIARQVIAIEIDQDLIEPLRLDVPENVSILHADALEVDFRKVTATPFQLVGNLPYNITTPLFKRFIEYRHHILSVTVMIQKEVAERIISRPGDASYGPLSVLLQYYAIPQWGFRVPPGAFHPKPKVDSAVIRLEWRTGVPDATGFTDFVHQAFGARRKKLINNLVRMLPGETRHQLLDWIRAARIAEDARPENLSVQDFHRLYNQRCRH